MTFTCTLSHCIDKRGMIAIRPYACAIIDVVNNIVRPKTNSISHMYFSYVEVIEISFIVLITSKALPENGLVFLF